MVTLLRGGQEMATFDEEEGWQSADPILLQVLNNILEDTPRSGADPDRELTIAQTAADALGPAWDALSDDLPPFDPDVVY